MENAIVDARKDVQNNDDLLLCFCEDMDSAEDNRVSKRVVRKVKPEHLFPLDSRIPKQIISFDEQYFHRCLELIHISSLKAASCNIPLDIRGFSDSLSSRKISKTDNLNRFVIECPSVAGAENVFISSSGDSILGAITESNSMLNILKSPLLRQLGASDGVVNIGRTGFVDVGEPIYSSSASSPGGVIYTMSHNLQKEMAVLGDCRYKSEPGHKRLGSVSSTNSTCSDQSSASASVPVSQGMLHCTWNDGFPQYVFSIDDRREIYVANLLKVKSSDGKVLDYVYTFCSRSGSRKEGFHEVVSDIVGKMRVSTSFTLLSDNAEIMETQFLLFGVSDDCVEKMQTPSHTLKKNKGFPKKVVDVFKGSHTYKQSSSKLGVSSAILEDSSCEPCHDSHNNLDPMSRGILLEDHPPPNLELAAVIVKDYISKNNNEVNNGGWGLKFLKKVGSSQTNASVETMIPSQCCPRNNGDCSTSMDILIPAGFHGGPRIRNGGPSSLTKRWKTGGCCDCGGWDIGCPLTVLNTRPIRKEDYPQTDVFLQSKGFDLFVEGPKQGAPIMQMVSIHDDLYYIHFQSTLSALQSFSIAAAIIHTHSPTLRPKLYKSK